jgi:hypothetical protein
MSNANIYTVGGTVQAGKGVYIPRRADEELVALCRAGTFVYILTPRQMGKSSLMVRTAERLAEEATRSVMIDLTQIGVQVSAEEWYLGLLATIGDQLQLETDVIYWWQARANLSMTQRLTLFFQEVLLAEVAEPVVVFVDEIDTTLSLPFTDDFYATIRYFYNARAHVPEFRRLSFTLIGVATPSDLIRDPQRTPFNIGQRVDLTDFTFEEALPLADGLGLPPDEALLVLRWVLKWTGGHPYLTQRLCCALTNQAKRSWSEADLGQLVVSVFFGKKSEEDANLRFVRDMLTRRVPAAVNKGDVLNTYYEVRRGRAVPDEEQSVAKSHLKLSGIVCRENAVLRVRNLIYAEVFDDKWIKEHLPAWIRQMAVSIKEPSRPLCFVTMPFGKKPSDTGSMVDFDAIYRELIAPAIVEAGLEPLRADEEMDGGIIHKHTFERLILCEYAVADLTTNNANVFYNLGIRHAVRPWSTVLLFASGISRLPFDVAILRAMVYQLTAEGFPASIASDKAALVGRLVAAREAATENPQAATDSPIFQLLEGFPNFDHTKTDAFRDRVRYSHEVKQRLAFARKEGVEALRSLEEELGNLKYLESGVVIDLFLSYRAVKAWDEVIAMVDKMSRQLATTVMVQEQLALALVRTRRGEEAEKVLQDLLSRHGPSSETLALLGRVYKDRWEAALQSGMAFLARGLLEKAIHAYLRGFEADWRNSYPGINAVTLMELKELPDPRRAQLIPVITYAVERRIATGKSDYWDYATLLELAMLAKDEQKVMAALSEALASVRESWESETTARNLRLIREARERRQEIIPWAKEVEEALLYRPNE